jgi:hypothetical protein
MDHNTPRTLVAACLIRSAEYLQTLEANGIIYHRDYNDLKASQLLDALGDLLVAEARIAAWFVDLGTNGCQLEEGDNNSIGGVPCIAGGEDDVPAWRNSPKEMDKSTQSEAQSVSHPQ